VAAVASGTLPRANSSSGSGCWDECGDSSPSQPGKVAAATDGAIAPADFAQASAEQQQQQHQQQQEDAEQEEQRTAQAAQQQAESLKQVCHVCDA
jgi:hypothetical protein